MEAAKTAAGGMWDQAKWDAAEKDAEGKVAAALWNAECGGVTIHIPSDAATGGLVPLSAIDLMSMGRAVPMVWYFQHTLDSAALLSTLGQALIAYPFLSGRYTSEATAVELTNRGVPVLIETEAGMTIAEAIAHFPIGNSNTAPAHFPGNAHERFVPDKKAMDPDAGNPDAPLMSIKITQFAGGSGTAIGLLVQHGVADAATIISFVRHWSVVFRGGAITTTPSYDRSVLSRLSAGTAAGVADADADAGAAIQPPLPPDTQFPRYTSIPQGTKHMPEFVGQMPKIMGAQACVVPFSKAALAALKATAITSLTGDDASAFISTDDVLTARVWQAFCQYRCGQVGVPLNSTETTTTLARAVNIRQRTEPALGADFCGNAAINIYTELPVHQLLAMTAGEVAVRLRASILERTTPKALAEFTGWAAAKYAAGCQAKFTFDKNALTLIVSSWRFDWEGANFSTAADDGGGGGGRGRPLCFDQGCNVPVVAVFTPRAGGDRESGGGGVDVWHSGKPDALQEFSSALTA
jgi:hypothetical protein